MFDDGMSKQDKPVQMMMTEIQNVTVELNMLAAVLLSIRQ
jgi:hypothetical protein